MVGAASQHRRVGVGVTLGQGPLERPQVYQVSCISLTRFLAGIPLGRVFVCGVVVVVVVVPGRNGERRVGLPIFQDFGVDARSRTSTSAVHTV